MRKMLTEEQLQSNIEGMLPQFERFLDFSGDAILINNVEWLRNLNYIDFLRAENLCNSDYVAIPHY